jgi:hypothetical protein
MFRPQAQRSAAFFIQTARGILTPFRVQAPAILPPKIEGGYRPSLSGFQLDSQVCGPSAECRDAQT